MKIEALGEAYADLRCDVCHKRGGAGERGVSCDFRSTDLVLCLRHARQLVRGIERVLEQVRMKGKRPCLVECRGCGKVCPRKYSDDNVMCRKCQCECASHGHEPDDDDPKTCFNCGGRTTAEERREKLSYVKR